MSEDENTANHSRRNFLRKALTAIPLTIVATNAIAATSIRTGGEGVVDDYMPTFFNPAEWNFLIAAVERLIPTDKYGPGGVSEGVPIFIDKQMEMPYGWGKLWYMHPPFADAIPELGYQSHMNPREVYRHGIKMLNHHCLKEYASQFHQLDITRQEVVLRDVEKDEIKNLNISGKLFFEQLLANSKEGYLADPVHGGNQTLASWKLVGFPGARVDYLDTVHRPGLPYPYGPVSISRKRGA
ncbi:gluconate 2-dehydrogenase subunit 3 family protein [Scandinavium manionii]|uniref:gluconate 2-dehydrogenase subunit 3 family protein n=1 Tax=Scandinavium manionii TaxID=2926520 RepID=UPI00135C17C0|nr:gluconate 2-dehydrogenase subunit 3 family protein [Scandinavium manionii]MCS2164230.1 gluconate 2-dehydrogenase subunit 3 family protein [Scandinavium manionii]